MTLAKLSEKGLVSAERSASDARRATFAVTSLGEGIAQALLERALLRQRRLLNGFTKDEESAFMRLLEKLQINIDEAASSDSSGT